MVRWAFLLILPVVLAGTEKQPRQLPYGINTQGAGAAVGQYGHVTTGSEDHDKKNFGINFSTDKGHSNNYSGTQAGVGVSGAAQQQVGYPGYYPGYYPHYPYPQYPTYPGYGSVGAAAGAVQAPYRPY